MKSKLATHRSKQSKIVDTSMVSTFSLRSSYWLQRRHDTLRNFLFVGRYSHQSARRLRFPAAALATQPTPFSVLGCFYISEKYSQSQSSPFNNHNTSILASSTRKSSIAHRIATRLRRWCDGVWLWLRATEIVARFAPLVILAPASCLSERMCDWTWNYIRWTITQLGPCYIKLAQWIATRRDVVPAFLCQRLGVLHDRGIAHPAKASRAALAAALGDDWESVCTVEDVIGCGSAAQVYRGTLRGRPVALKVLHPGLADAVTRDLSLVDAVAQLLHPWIPMVNLPRVVENFGAILYRQTDLRVEAENLRQFRENFGTGGVIVFPEPVFVSKNVLIEDLVEDARPISDYIASDFEVDDGGVRKQLASPLLRAFLKMVFIDNFVHCDLHPGNILVKTEEVPERTGWFSPTGPSVIRKIVFLDAGIATSLSKDDQRNLLDLFRAVLLDNGDQAGRLMVERAKNERCSSMEGGVDAFAQGISDLVSEFHDRRREGLTLGAVRIGSLLSRVLDLCRRYGVEIDPAMASIVVSTLVLEGLGRSLEPNLNLIDFAVPFVLGRGQVIAS